MKIIFLGRYNTGENLTGPEKVAKRLYHNMIIKNENTVFLTYYFKDCEDSSVFKRMFGRTELRVIPKVKRMGIFSVILYLIKEKPQIIHVITFERFLIPIILIKIVLNSNLIFTVHGLFRIERKNLYVQQSLMSKIKDSIAEYLLINYSDKLIFLSNISLRKAKQNYNINEKKCLIIPNGLDSYNLLVKKEFDFSETI